MALWLSLVDRPHHISFLRAMCPIAIHVELRIPSLGQRARCSPSENVPCREREASEFRAQPHISSPRYKVVPQKWVTSLPVPCTSVAERDNRVPNTCLLLESCDCGRSLGVLQGNLRWTKLAFSKANVVATSTFFILRGLCCRTGEFNNTLWL